MYWPSTFFFLWYRLCRYIWLAQLCLILASIISCYSSHPSSFSLSLSLLQAEGARGCKYLLQTQLRKASARQSNASQSHTSLSKKKKKCQLNLFSASIWKTHEKNLKPKNEPGTKQPFLQQTFVSNQWNRRKSRRRPQQQRWVSFFLKYFACYFQIEVALLPLLLLLKPKREIFSGPKKLRSCLFNVSTHGQLEFG